MAQPRYTIYQTRSAVPMNGNHPPEWFSDCMFSAAFAEDM